MVLICTANLRVTAAHYIECTRYLFCLIYLSYPTHYQEVCISIALKRDHATAVLLHWVVNQVGPDVFPFHIFCVKHRQWVVAAHTMATLTTKIIYILINGSSGVGAYARVRWASGVTLLPPPTPEAEHFCLWHHLLLICTRVNGWNMLATSSPKVEPTPYSCRGVPIPFVRCISTSSTSLTSCWFRSCHYSGDQIHPKLAAMRGWSRPRLKFPSALVTVIILIIGLGTILCNKRTIKHITVVQLGRNEWMHYLIYFYLISWACKLINFVMCSIKNDSPLGTCFSLSVSGT